METYLLRRTILLRRRIFALTPAEADSLLQNFISRDLTRLDHHTHMHGLIYEAPLGLDSRWIPCQEKFDYLKLFLYILHQFRNTQKQYSPRPPFDSFTCLYPQIHSFRVRAHGRNRVVAKSQIRVGNWFEQMHYWNRDKFFSVSAPSHSAQYLRAPEA